MSLTTQEVLMLQAGPNPEAPPIVALATEDGRAKFFNEPEFTNYVLPAMGVVPGRPDFAEAATTARLRLLRDETDIDSYAYATLAQAYADNKSFEANRRDGMTGLLSRNAWLAQAEACIREAVRTEGLVAIVLLDLDAFKTANDELGHLGGDRILISLGNLLRNSVRDGHLLSGRLGGDEFATILRLEPASDLAPGRRHKTAGEGGSTDSLLAAYERVVAEVDGVVGIINEDLAQYGVARLAVSAGIAVWQPGVALERLLVEADAEVKRQKTHNAEAVLEGFPAEQRALAIQYMQALVAMGAVDSRRLPLPDNGSV